MVRGTSTEESGEESGCALMEFVVKKYRVDRLLARLEVQWATAMWSS